MRTQAFFAQKVYNHEKVSRKTKKFFLGLRLSKAKIKRMIKSFKVIHHQDNIYDHSEFNMEPFCPNCGCTLTRSTVNLAPYPELWEKTYCLRCGTKVAEVQRTVVRK